MKPMIEHFAEINATLNKEESSIMDELEGALNRIVLLKRDNADSYQHIENLELQQYAIEEYYQDKLYQQDRKIKVLIDALKAIATPLEYKAVMLEIKSLSQTKER